VFHLSRSQARYLSKVQLFQSLTSLPVIGTHLVAYNVLHRCMFLRIIGINYPERDPKFKDNWRGRSRMLDTDKEDVINYETGNEEDEKEEEIGWNYQALRNAMSRGMSFWRSHTDCE